MNSLEDPNVNICTHCDRKITSYPSQFCRRKLHLHQNDHNETNEIRDRSIQLINIDPKLNEFIKETKDNSECCDDFVEWIPSQNLNDVKYLTKGGNSKIFSGNSDLLPIPLALKVIKDSDNIDDIINEFKMHHKCRNQNVIPFYGITKLPEENKYAMIMKYAKHEDLRKYIRKFFQKLTWTDKVEIIIKLSKALNSLHQMNLLHKDFHCKNILVDEDERIFLSDFGLCKPVDSELAQNSIQGVLPYIAPEVLKNKPYTKQSEVYSMSMIMWELTSNESPFSDKRHDKELAFAILNGLRPKIIEGTPDFYANIMKQCWNSDPSQRPDSSILPKLFEEMKELCKFINNKPNTVVLLSRNIPDSSEPNRVNTSKKKSDVDLAVEVGQGPLVEVRRLQGLLQEKENKIKELEIKKADLERTIDLLNKQIRGEEESEDSMKKDKPAKIDISIVKSEKEKESIKKFIEDVMDNNGEYDGDNEIILDSSEPNRINTSKKKGDVEFAVEMGQGLLVEVRRLQGLLREKENKIKELEINKANLERTIDLLNKQIRGEEEFEDSVKKLIEDAMDNNDDDYDDDNDPRYFTQTYNFSLEDLNQSYNNQF
ncbi:kinase-like domain-containing protein [Glomus cerebriforme]|uniref:Kinase-like domain-containing protein n=1 Tax=Glomus cerebriforme TaxID=658196 RepID=A0A397T278_9GLOM|nr:kinase-like domain-containing protein [Glomus cerebriforme]